ncbi:hypothetical protein ACIBI4_04295 [Streptomyces sp. NPDC050418]|uniref:hypothetical protein n=1 Tax=Streptomyces sp. NPDC050418 TaxID=3365612 RepID=UPI00379AD6A5
MNELADYIRDKQSAMVADLKTAGVKVAYADPIAKFEGHGLCDSDEWINGMVAGPEGDGDFHKGDDVTTVCPYVVNTCLSRESYHPKHSGTTGYAAVMNDTLNAIDYKGSNNIPIRSERDIPPVSGMRRISLTGGCLIALIAGLCLLGVLLGSLAYQRANADERAHDQLNASVADARERLRSAARDGDLTDEEIRQALRMSQAGVRDTARAQNVVTIKALVHGTHASALGGGEVSSCRAFKVTLSADDATVSDTAADGC